MKQITLLMAFVSIAWVTTAQNFATVKDHPGNFKAPTEADNGNRSTPAGTLIYSQPFACPPENGLRSESLTTNSEVADDFLLTSAADINIVRWWFFIADDPATTGWTIRIYDNASCLPSGLLNTYNIAAADVNYEYVCNAFGINIYDCWANLGSTFSAVANTHYWISVQAIGTVEYWSQYGTAGTYQNCPAAFKSVYFGAPNFVPVGDAAALGYNADFAYELYNGESIPSDVPISNWAIGIGIFLILAAAVVRFRKLV